VSVLDNEVKKYLKKDFTVRQKRTLKQGKRIILIKKKGGLGGILGEKTVVYLYSPKGDSDTRTIREFLKDYKKFYKKYDFDEDDKAVFLSSGEIDKGLFGDLKKALVRDKDILDTVKTKILPKKALHKIIAKKSKRIVEEERIRERITEREITRRRISEEHISVKGVLKAIKRFEPLIRPKKEKDLEKMLVSNLQASYPDVRTQLTYERARIDAQIGKIGIEIKYQPSAGDFDRLYGQIEKYLKHLDCVIAVIGSERSKQSTKYFKQRIRDRGWLNKRVYVIAK